MTRSAPMAFGLALLISPALASGLRAAEVLPPNFQEIFSLVRSNLAGAKPEDLDGAAAQGLLQQLRPQVLLVTNAPGAQDPAGTIARSTIFDDGFGYVRIGNVGGGLAEKFKASLENLSSAKKLKGLVLDLRFASGQDYAAAVGVADQFIATEKAQLSLGAAALRSTAKTNALTLPATVLVNRQTAGAGEALAALLRQNRVALLLGGDTAGEAFSYRDFKLSNGQQLRIATGTVKLGDGAAMPVKGVKPDIAIAANATDERAWLDDPYLDFGKAASLAAGAGAATNAPRRRLNEAELVRRQREGQNPDEDAPVLRLREPEPAKPLVRDPALARALDLLKGLAVVRQYRAP